MFSFFDIFREDPFSLITTAKILQLGTRLRRGLNPNAERHSAGASLLFYAMHRDEPVITILLLQYGADISFEDAHARQSMALCAIGSEYFSSMFIKILLLCGLTSEDVQYVRQQYESSPRHRIAKRLKKFDASEIYVPFHNIYLREQEAKCAFEENRFQEAREVFNAVNIKLQAHLQYEERVNKYKVHTLKPVWVACREYYRYRINQIDLRIKQCDESIRAESRPERKHK